MGSVEPGQLPWTGRLLSILDRRWRAFTVVIVLALVGLGLSARGIGIDNSLKIWYLDGDPILAEWQEFQDQFGNDEIIVVAVTDPHSAFSPAALERNRRASERIQSHPKIRTVTSLGISRHVEGDALEIRTLPLLDDGPVTPESAQRARERVAENPIYAGNIVGDSERMTLILVEPERLDDTDAERPQLLADVRAVADAELMRDGGGYHMSGMGVVYEGLNAASLRDSQVFLTLAYVAVLAGLWFMFRSVLWVFVGAGIVTVATGITIGVSGLAGRDLNMVTAVLPTLLMAVGILDLVHLIDAYREHQPDGRPVRGTVLRAAGLIFIPCAFNSLTDVAGFASLAAADMAAIRDFGWLAAVGLLALFAALFAIATPVLTRFGCPAPRTSRGGDRLAAIAGGMFRIALRRRRLVIALAPVLFAVAVLGMTRLVVDTYTIGFLAPDHPVRADYDTIETEFGPFIPYDLIVDTEPGNVKEPALLHAVERAERSFEQLPQVARATGLPEIVARLNQVVMDGDPEARVIPDQRNAVAQELLLYETDEDNDLEKLTDPARRRLRVTARATMPSGRGIGDTLRELEARARAELGDQARVGGVGYMEVNSHVLERITATQIKTFAIAFAVIALGMMLMFRSLRLGAIALVPNLLPVAMTLGFMGFTGIRLDVATVLIASILIGIAVNDTTHLLFRFKHELSRNRADVTGAVERMMAGTGRAVVGSSLILVAGFAVLLLSQVKSILLFGLLCIVAIGFALIADLIITPALLLGYRGRHYRGQR